LRLSGYNSFLFRANLARASWALRCAIPLPVIRVRLTFLVLVFFVAGYSHAQGPNLTTDATTDAPQARTTEAPQARTVEGPSTGGSGPSAGEFRPGAASPWNRFLSDVMQSGLGAARSNGVVQQSGQSGAGGPGAGNSVDYFQLIGDLGAGFGAGHNNAFGATMRSLPKLSQWLRSGITVPLGSQASGPGRGEGPGSGGSPGGGPSGSKQSAFGQGGGPGSQSGGFSFGYKNSLLGGSGGSVSGLNAGSASAVYTAPRSAGSRFGFSASATAGTETSSGDASSFGGGGAAAGLGMGSSKGSMFGAAAASGGTAGSGAAMGGGMHGGGPVQGVGPGAGHAGGGSKVGAAVNLKLTF
jgi:hypothetical protein